MEKIHAVTTSLFGKGSIALLPEELKKRGLTRGLIVTDSFLYKSGAADRVGSCLLMAGLEYAVYYLVQPNPTIEVVEECLKAAVALEIDVLVAVGGGSAIDTAKAVSIVLANGGQVRDYEGVGKSRKPGIPIVAVNTTAGTGSEVTSFYIVTDSDTHSKMCMVDTNCMVTIAVDDADFMMTMPKGLTASTGMDAMTHAVEAVVAKRATPYTDKDALWAIKTIKEYLPAAVSNGGDVKAREMMAYAQYSAGMAFSNALLGIVHSMAHKTGAAYSGGHIVHGCANAMYLPKVIKFNSKNPEAAERYAKIAKFIGLAGSTDLELTDALIARLREMNEQLDIPACIKDYEGGIIDEAEFMEKLPKVAELAVGDACTGSNPRSIDPEQMAKLLKCCFYDEEVTF